MMRYNDDDDERTGQRCPRCHCTFTVLPDEWGLHDCPRCGATGRERDDEDDEPEDEPGPEDDQPPPRPRMRAYVEERSQHARGSTAHRFGGPDTYVAVQVVPVGVAPLRALQAPAARRRGIRIIYVGEGYARHTGPRSMLGRARADAAALAAEINAASLEETP